MKLSSTRDFLSFPPAFGRLNRFLFLSARCNQVVGSEVEGSGRRSHKSADTQADLEIVSMVLPLSSHSPLSTAQQACLSSSAFYDSYRSLRSLVCIKQRDLHLIGQDWAPRTLCVIQLV